MPDWLVTMMSLKAGVGQPFQRRARAGENFHVFRPVQVIFFRDQRAIAVQEIRRVHLPNCVPRRLAAIRMKLKFFRRVGRNSRPSLSST
jgi:hypothetical protein